MKEMGHPCEKGEVACDQIFRKIHGFFGKFLMGNISLDIATSASLNTKYIYSVANANVDFAYNMLLLKKSTIFTQSLR